MVVYDGRNEVARHERLSTRSGSQLVLDHYLEALVRKSGAFPGSTAPEQARLAGRFTPVRDNWWAAVRSAHGDAEGTRALIQVLLLLLLLGRHMRHAHVVAGLAAAFRAGALTADAVALEGRKAAEGDTPAPPAPTPEPPAPTVEEHTTVTLLADYRLTHLPPGTRPLALGGRLRPTTRPPPDRRPGHQPGTSDMTILRQRELTEEGATAAFPRDKSLRAFDFDADPNVDPAAIPTLADVRRITSPRGSWR